MEETGEIFRPDCLADERADGLERKTEVKQKPKGRIEEIMWREYDKVRPYIIDEVNRLPPGKEGLFLNMITNPYETESLVDGSAEGLYSGKETPE